MDPDELRRREHELMQAAIVWWRENLPTVNQLADAGSGLGRYCLDAWAEIQSMAPLYGVRVRGAARPADLE